ncbi:MULTISPECIES: hypothetical protein [Streptomyces]|uniref:Gram-positive cocci surface proteins LPxTG domain-containing protein n=1 Tax=Streptomyces doudnae TaxID=3075536 RepID=A0ABD5EF05_9ACTN|nr:MULTISPECIES: hypothetical protein [unclassified Streptomyces]MDT0433261.1 hypothetical protein [Streptomyces sp. DSM 41981]MYQ67820.1 hypothetical protein [Streptomyces sp. SID4950]SCE40371.1 hypothetical protein GA0115242_135818 [Streptomyces sp. SolWspMP-5a-2]
MPNTPAGHRAFRRTAAAVGAAALMALGAAAPAAADGDSPPGLVLGDLGPFEGVRPGSTFEVPATFTNAGSEALDTVYLSYEVTRGLSRTEVPSNCLRYEIPSYDEAPELERVVCEFDQRIEPGTVYAPARTWTLKAGENALWDRLRVVVATEPSDPGDSGAEPVRGTDPAVALVEKPDATPATSGGRGDYDVAELEVKAENTADFQVTGGRLTGAVGDVVDLKATFTNAGPGWVLRPLGRSVTEVLVDLPEGTTVTKGNGYCDKVSARRYSCGTAQSWVDEKGGETYAFKVRIDKKVAGAEGSVALAGPARPFDKVTSNDKAAITVDVTGTGPGSGGTGSGTGGSATPSAGATSGTGTSGGSGSGSATGGSGSATGGSAAATGGSTLSTDATGDLASTGAGSALPLAGAAAAVVGLGAGTVLLARRRASRR